MSGLELSEAFTRWSISGPLRPGFEVISGNESVQPGVVPAFMAGEIPAAQLLTGQFEAMRPDLLRVDLPPPALALLFAGFGPEFLSGDFHGMRLEEVVLHAEHGPLGKVLVDQASADFSTSTDSSQPISVAPLSSEPATAASGPLGSSSNQAAPAAGVSAGRVTVPQSVYILRGEELARLGRTDESTVNQTVESAQAGVPRAASASLETTHSEAPVATPPADQVGDPPAAALDGSAGVKLAELPLPHRGGLIAGAIPLDQASLEHAVDVFFNQLEGLGMGQVAEQGPSRMIPFALTVVGSVAAVEVARRRLRERAGGWRPSRGQYPPGSEELLGFPELPGSWSTRLT
jgi:hypothetical protein